MIDIKNLITNQKYHSKRWDCVCSSDIAEERFLVMFIPAMEYTLLNLELAVTNNYCQSEVISENTLFHIVKRDLCSTLKNMVARVCVLELHSARANNLLVGETTKDRFNYFIQQLQRTENSLAILKKYPLLKQQIEIAITQYINTKIEFFSRLFQDKDEIYHYFLNNDSSFLLSNVITAGDKHCEGRSVMILEFNNNTSYRKVVYKPRSLAIDDAFQQFISWFNQNLPDVKLSMQVILLKDNYGWCEFISTKSCESKDAIERYYHRMGYLLMLTYLLGGSDLHYENIIAHGEYPVIVDYECFFKPFFLLDHSDDKNPSRHLVTDTCFLPNKIMVSREYKGIDISAFSGKGDEEAPYLTMEWKESGTDTMHLVRTQKKIEHSHNIPLLNTSKVDPIHYQQDFLNGFSKAYTAILRLLPILNGLNSPLNVFKNVDGRIVFRNTSDYVKLLAESYHPTLLINSENRDNYFHWLTKDQDEFLFIAAISDSEISDIGQSNIPAFFCKSDGIDILNSLNKKINLPVFLPGWQCVQYCIQNIITAEDLYLQKTLIKNSFEAMRLNESFHLSIQSDLPQLKIKPNKKMIKDDITVRAEQIAKAQLDQLNKLCISNRRRLFWPSLEMTFEQTWNAGFTDISLYNGVPGIVLALAYGGIALNDDRYTCTARVGLESLRQTIKTHGMHCFKTIGAFSGIGGLIYTLANLYHLWKDETIKSDLETLLKFIPNLIDKDSHLDILSGSAGCLLSLLRLKNIISSEILNPLMDHCIQHILTQYPIPSEFGIHHSLPTSAKPLLGFSHGVAGITLALAQYNQLNPSSRVKHWIMDALSYERSLFSTAEKNWPDFQNYNGSMPRFVTAWCHGALGIGLARLDMQRYWEDKEFNNEIECAISTTLQKGFSQYNNLCHGNLGNLELLLNASEMKQDDLLKSQYLDKAWNIIHSIESNGAKCDIPSSGSTPGLMTGIAGIAYQLMRVADPKRVPSLLLLKIHE